MFEIVSDASKGSLEYSLPRRTNRDKQTETNERLKVTFESWPEFNVETEWPKIEKHLLSRKIFIILFPKSVIE